MRNIVLGIFTAFAVAITASPCAFAQADAKGVDEEEFFGTPPAPKPADPAPVVKDPEPPATPEVKEPQPPPPATPEVKDPAPAPETPTGPTTPPETKTPETGVVQPPPPPTDLQPLPPPSEGTPADGTTPPKKTVELPTTDRVVGVDVETSEVSEELINIDIDDQPLRDVVKVFSRISKVNIITGEGVEGRVTVRLENVTWRDALESILDDFGLVLMERRKGIFHVVSKASLQQEPVAVEIINLNFISATNIVPVVSRMLIHSNATVMAMPAANVLVLKETPSQIQTIRKAVEEVDKPREQVYIESKFVELNDKAIEDLGINWQVLEGYNVTAGNLTRTITRNERSVRQDALGNFNIGQTSRNNSNSSESSSERNRTFDGLLGNYTGDSRNDTSTSARTGSNSSGQTDYITGISGRNFEELTVDPSSGRVTMQTLIPYDKVDVRTAVLSASDLALTLSALKQMDGVAIVSNPKLLVSNGEKATIHIGRNEPNVVAVPQGDTGDRFAYQLDQEMPFIEIGVKLQVQPTVNTRDNITIRIVPELSRLLGQKAAGDANITFPITQIRRIETEFSLQSGKTVAIGGLTENNEVERVRKVPVLGDIPLIGKYLFTHTHTEKIQDEIIIFVSVNMGNVEDLAPDSGIPEGGRLIHNHMRAEELEKARRAAEAGKEDEEIERILSKYRTAENAP